MTIRIGINGFGRMGRLILRAASNRPELQFVQINDPAGEPATLAHLLNFDSVHGRWDRAIDTEGDELVIDGQRIRITHNKELAAKDWSGCDVVVMYSGNVSQPVFRNPPFYLGDWKL